MKKILYIYLFFQATFMHAHCPGSCPLDPIIGVWLSNSFIVTEAPPEIVPELITFQPNGIIDDVFLDLPSTAFGNIVFEGSGARGLWRKISEGVYQIRTAEYLGVKAEIQECCQNVNLGISVITVLCTLDPNDSNTLLITGKLELFPPEDTCLTAEPLECHNVAGKACRFNFVQCPTDPGVYIGCQSCIGLAIRQKYCAECVDPIICPVTQQ